jgi:small subunit ribosomal protein S18
MNKVSKKDRPIIRPAYFNHLDVETLKRYIDYLGRIKSRGKTGLSQKQQAALATAVKRARHLALLPFVGISTDVYTPRGPRTEEK